MFGRAIQMHFVKVKNKDNEKDVNIPTVEDIQNLIANSAIIIGGVFIVYRLIATGCKIAIIASKAIAK